MSFRLSAAPRRPRHSLLGGVLLSGIALSCLGQAADATHAGATPAQAATTPPMAREALPPPPDPLAALELADPALTLELVASEPLVQSPVAITFDERGRLYVVEMIDYPHDRGRFPGRVSLLVDEDGDGRYERGTVFADDLPWPSGAASYDGGLFVSASPDILYLKDTDGDGRADERRVVVTGFGNTVPEPMPDMVVNGFAWGLDNRLYGATSRNGGQVTTPGLRQRYDLRGRDFSIDPRTLQLRPETGGGQFGVSFDAVGRRFVSSNANHLMQVMYDLRAATRVPFVDLPRPALDIPADGPAAIVHRLSPDETWRVRRTEWRTSGKVRGLVEYGGRPSGYFTSACSATVYSGDALPSEYHGSVFVAEPANNLVHRKVLQDTGVPLTAVRPTREIGTEFLRSRSVWVRPVNFATGPDGALYVVDMHRFVVEDPKTIPAGILADDEIRAGSARGRIYRVTRRGAPRRPVPPVAAAEGAHLARWLADPNGWARETAARLLYERQDARAVPALEALAVEAVPVTRIRALYALQGLGRLQARHVLTALAADDADVRTHGVRLAPAFDADRAVRRAVLASYDDPSPHVRYQLALTLGALSYDEGVEATIVRLAEAHADDLWMRTALTTTLSHPVGRLLSTLAGMPAVRDTAGGRMLIGAAMRTIGARGQRHEIDLVLDVLDTTADDQQRLAWAGELVGGFARGDVDVRRGDPDGRLASTLALAQRLVGDRTAAPAVRQRALDLLARDPRIGAEPFLGVLDPAEPSGLQTASLTALRSRAGPAVHEAILARWTAFTPRLRQDAAALLLTRPEGARRVLAAMQEGDVAPSDLSAGQAQALLTHGDAEIARVAATLLDLDTSSRQEVVNRYRPALSLEGDPTRGRQVFADLCATCHRLDDVGVEIGPSLLGVRTHGREGLLIDLFDPNRKIDPAYLYYEVQLRDGSTVSGAIVADTPAALTLAQGGGGAPVIVARAQIAGMRGLGRSLMPEGLEASLDAQAVADLLAYLFTR